MDRNTTIDRLKLEHPTIKSGSDGVGYTELNAQEYKETIEKWADNLIAVELEAAQVKATKESALAKLAALGLTIDDLTALGL
jgi:hypothetical protein